MSIYVTEPYKELPISGGTIVSKWHAMNGQLTSATILAQRQDTNSAAMTFVNNGGLIRIEYATAAGIVLPAVGPIQVIIGGVIYNLTYTSTSSGGGITKVNTSNAFVSVVTGTGYINDIIGRPGYYIKIKYQKMNPATATYEDFGGLFTYSPNVLGVAKIDVAGVMRTMVRLTDDFAHDTINKADTNLSARGQVLYCEGWLQDIGGGILAPVDQTFDVSSQFQIVNGAMQIQHIYGSNMADFLTEATGTLKAKFVTGFKRPTYFPGFPFDVSFIYGETVNDTPNVKRFHVSYKQHTPVSLNGSLLNDTEANYLNRLLMPKYFIKGVDRVNLYLGYDGYGDVDFYVAEGYVVDEYITVH